jgi:hypothetical protein
LNKLFRRRPAPPPAPPRRTATARVRSQIEPLEGRVAPAALINATTITFNDLDGDVVTVQFTKNLFDLTKTASENHLDGIFKFVDAQHTASLFASTDPQQLQLIDLSQVANIVVHNVPRNPAFGTGITVTAVHGAGDVGDALTNIGAIKASQLALGDVTIAGDLGQIDAGTAKSVVGIASLSVVTLGKFGATTQPTGTNATDALESRITGKLSSLNIGGDLFGYVHVIDGNDIVNNDIVTTAPAKIGRITIEGSLRGNATVATTSDNTGTIECAGRIASVSILGTSATDPAGIIGGGGKNSGALIAKGFGTVTIVDGVNGGGGASSGTIVSKSNGIASLTIGGGLKGGAGSASGGVLITGAVPVLNIDGGLTGGTGEKSGDLQITGAVTAANITGGLTGGTGAKSGTAAITGNVKVAKIADDLTGGDGANSGSLQISGNLTKLVLTGDMIGGKGATSGGVLVGGALTSATITGALNGGDGDGSAVLSTGGRLGTVVINGDLGSNGTGPRSGGVSAGGALASLTVNGKITGGTGALTGFIEGLKGIGRVAITGDVTGGLGQDSATITSGGNFASLIIGGKLSGGQGVNSGSIFSGTDFLNPGKLSVVRVNGGIEGGDGFDSGSIIAGGALGKVFVGTTAVPANLLGGDGDFSGVVWSDKSIASVIVTGFVQGDVGKNSGSIQSTGSLGRVNISGALSGGDGDASGTIIANDNLNDGTPDLPGNIGKIVIGGDIAGGLGVQSGRIQADGNLGSLTAVALKGGIGVDSGSIETGRGFLRAGDVSSINFSGAITSTTGSVDPSLKIGGRLGSLTVGAGVSHGDLRIGNDLASAAITGDFADSHLTAHGRVSPRGQDVAIARLIVTGNVSNSQIFAGGSLDGTAGNADASIGLVKVTGNWTASDLVAGAMDVNDDGFGNVDDLKISSGIDTAKRISHIASIVVNGAVEGTSDADDHFGFEAQQILAFRVGTTNLALHPHTGGQTFELGTHGDVTVREIPV